ncbi:hypothetical protein TR51_24110 [Kitasatospora griseola]|uniref:PPE family domain-containing protein n=1 Tax=Kitasatospora griseola TaxID=2064 RepID=A0A0D0PP37_KITGR|nr:hypothetical protein [Kitasatospora griseola]KIQ62212.1 hypothetical protein TR51_24110 [Kitasatospora griseola]
MTEKRFVRAVHDGGGEIGGASHEQLMAMVQHSDPIAVMQVAQRLLLASQKLDEVSEELHAHMSGLDWEGAAADSFKSWGSGVSKTAMGIADYSKGAGTYMASAGEMLAAVKSGMPPVPHDDMETVSRYDGQPNGAVNTGGDILGGVLGIGGSAGRWAAGEVAGFVDSDWVTPAQAQAAQQRVDQARNEAVQQMTKLTQAYEQSITELNALEPPVFPQPPGGEAWHDDSVDVSVGDGNGKTGRKPGDGGPVIWEPPGPPKPPKPQPPEPPGPVPPPTPHPPVPVPPPTPIQDPTTRIDHTPTQSPPDPTLPVTGGGGGGTGGGGYGGGGGGLGGGGGGGYQGGPIPGGGSYTGGSAGAGRTGGTAATPTGTGQAGQAGQAGRAGASGMGGGMPHGGGAGAGGTRGGARGSGLVNRAGGTVGGRRGPAAGGEFTPGGTGLRARGERGADGRAGQGGFGGGQGGANRKGKPQGKRPDYLIEDEDTWTSGMGPANPGVIE